MDIKTRLKNLRKLKRLTQQQVADALNVSQVTYARYESGIRSPNPEMTIALAKLFNTTTDYLLGNDLMYEEDFEYGLNSQTYGEALKQERQQQDIGIQELAHAVGIDDEMLKAYESSEVFMSYFVFKKAVEFFGYGYYDFLQKYNLYRDYIPAQFNGDVEAYEDFKKARDRDAENEAPRTNERSPKETGDYSSLTKWQLRLYKEYERLKRSDDPKDRRDKLLIDSLLGLEEHEDG